MSNETPPLIQAPSAKEKKYDRQLRLWAAAGQRALEESHVLLVIPEVATGSASSVAGSEALKNLILPGIGQFTILDAAKVTEADLGVNFFLESNSLGKSRAEESRRLLEELNPDVQGHCLSDTIESLLREPARLDAYNLILLCGPVSHAALTSISSLAWRKEIPLVYIRSIGLYSVFSIQLPADFPIVDTHPDPDSIQDLRLLAPWPELLTELTTIGNIDSLSDDDHGHVPYILLLLHFLENWKESHGGALPDTFREKTQFRDSVRQGARTDNPEGGEENFDEAVSAVLKTINPPRVESSVQAVFEAKHCNHLTSTSSSFWYIAAAVKHFYESNQVLPLPGSLPDMKARSADYIRLQNIYKHKARTDAQSVVAEVRSLEGKFGRTESIPEAEVEAFCKNAAHVKVVSGSRIPLVQDDSRTADMILSTVDNEDSLIPILLALDATAAGTGEGAVTELFEKLLKVTNKGGIVNAAARKRVTDAYEEIQRARGGELHNISSLTGGMVAQEAIKVITRQYVPVHNTCIFDGTKAKSEVLRL